jgi:hypothetical protein
MIGAMTLDSSWPVSGGAVSSLRRGVAFLHGRVEAQICQQQIADLAPRWS